MVAKKVECHLSNDKSFNKVQSVKKGLEISNQFALSKYGGSIKSLLETENPKHFRVKG